MELNVVTILQILFGFLLLLMGRRLFWLFVGLIGFIVAAQLAADFLGPEPPWLVLVVALAVGLLGALIAVVIPALAAAVAGFLAGTYLVYVLLANLQLQPGPTLGWILAVVGGIIGAVLAVALLDWALIILSSLAGATAIVQAIALQPTVETIVFVVLVVIGVIVQAALVRRPPAEQPVTRYDERPRDF
jgi:MFS family permease